MKSKMRNRILAMLLSVAMVMNGSIPALASEAAPAAIEETGHKHTDECFTEEKVLICEDTTVAHAHGEGCYTTNITCGQEECAGHSHTDDCYDITVSTCGKEEHSHSDECNSEEATCVKEEHTHDAGCTTETEELVCGKVEVEGHTHDDSCSTTELTCTQEETVGHKHEDKCYTLTSTLICTIPENEATEQLISENQVEVTNCETCGEVECTCEVIEEAVCEACGEVECICEAVEETVCEICGEAECTCTVEEVVESVEYEDEKIKVTVTAVDENAIPENATLKVLPIVAEEFETEAQYAEVERQLQEEVEDENTDILGFIAYDITFVDADDNELEPNGQVQILMEYKKAILPADAEKIEEAEVTVVHLEENEKGEVAQLVDMSEEKQLSAIETTSANEVTMTEFETKSFSVFTIIWTAESSVLKAYCVNTAGSDIGAKEFEIAKQMVTTETRVEDLTKSIEDYQFERAYTAEDKNADNKKVIDCIRYNDSRWEYKDESQDWSEFGDSSLFFEYSTTVDVPRVPVVDTKAKGINISLFNYDGYSNVEKYKTFCFLEGSSMGVDSGAGYSDDTLKKQAKSDLLQYTPCRRQNARQNMVCWNLYDGYPALNKIYDQYAKIAESIKQRTEKGDSLGYFFGAEGNVKGVQVYSGLSGLLQQKKNGYYYYDSRLNHAQYNEETQKIDVYDAGMTHFREDDIPQFLPFDDINGTDSINGVYRSNNWNKREGYTKYCGDLWFGMKIDAMFYQPKNGRVNNDSMVFNFSGDDDMWVFIDGVKVLDVGGIHGKVTGNINFETGDVYVQSNSYELKTTIKDCFEAAYVESSTGKGESLQEYLDTIFVPTGKCNEDGTQEYTFKNYTEHKMDFFYMERGAGASNCMIEFNLPVIPKDSVTVHKEIENYDETETILNDVEFGFQMNVKGETENKFVPLRNYNYQLVKADGTVEAVTYKTDENGLFKLKHNEQAVFTKLTKDTIYYVAEVDISGAEYSKVVIDSNGVTDENSKDIAQTDKDVIIRSKDLVVGQNHLVNFKNTCSNFQHLLIKKLVKEKDQVYLSQDKTYTFEVTVGGGLYNGKYKIGTDYESALNASEQTTKNGQISLKANEVAVILGNATGIKDGKEITGFPARTSFAIREILSDQEQEIYKIPTYDIDENTVQEEYNESVSQYSDTATGEIKLGANAYVEITNALRYGELEIQKKLLTYNKSLGETSFVFKVDLYDYAGENVIFSDMVSLKFDDAGVTTYPYPKALPAGHKVIVTEVYSGASYELKESNGTINIVADTTGTASFTNDYVDGRLNGGGSILNVFKKINGTWSGTGYNDVLALPVIVKDDEEDSETTN